VAVDSLKNERLDRFFAWDDVLHFLQGVLPSFFEFGDGFLLSMTFLVLDLGISELVDGLIACVAREIFQELANTFVVMPILEGLLHLVALRKERFALVLKSLRNCILFTVSLVLLRHRIQDVIKFVSDLRFHLAAHHVEAAAALLL